MDEELLTTKQVGDLLQISPATLAQWRHAGNGPTYTRIGRCIRYRRVDVERFVAAGVRELGASRGTARGL